MRLLQNRTNRFATFLKKWFRKRRTTNLVIVLWNCSNLSCTFQLHCTLCQSYSELLLDSVHGAILFWAVRCTPHGLHRLRTSCRSPVSITCAAMTRSRASSVGDALNSVTMVCMASCSGRRACWSCPVAAAHFAVLLQASLCFFSPLVARVPKPGYLSCQKIVVWGPSAGIIASFFKETW